MSVKNDGGARTRRDRGGLVWPLLLNAVGVLLLLDNLGIISFDFWYAASRLWPIVLIAIGLDLLLGRLHWLVSLLIGLATVAVLVGGVFWLEARAPDELVTESIAQELGDVDAAGVVIGFGVGALDLRAMAPGSGQLIAGEISQSIRGTRVQQSYETEDGVALYSLHMSGTTRPTDWMRRRGGAPRWNLQLTPDVPLDLTVNTGVGQSHLDLRGLNLSNLTVDSGVGETRVTLPGAGQITATIEGGIGELNIEIPEGAAARISSDTGLGQTNVDAAFTRVDDVYITGNYDDSLDRIDLTISAGIGQVNVRTYIGR